MAITITKSRPKVTPLPGGGRLVEWSVITQDLLITDEFVLDASDGFYAPCELTLVEAELNPVGAAATIQPASGIAVGFTLTSNDAIGQAAVAAVHVRLPADANGNTVLIPSRATKLVIRPIPDIATGGTGIVTTKVTIRIPPR